MRSGCADDVCEVLSNRPAPARRVLRLATQPKRVDADQSAGSLDRAPRISRGAQLRKAPRARTGSTLELHVQAASLKFDADVRVRCRGAITGSARGNSTGRSAG
jgi:hypothetical protein